MLTGIGIDVVDISTLRAQMESDAQVTSRYFTRTEILYCSQQPNPYQNFAGTFAAKEAAMKALHTGFSNAVDWLNICVERAESGAPSLSLNGGALAIADSRGVKRLHVSISHEGSYAAAVVALEA